MKKTLAFFGMLSLSVVANAGIDTREAAISAVGTGTTLNVSTYVWTKAPATSSLNGRTGIQVANPTGNSASFAVMVSTSSTTPGEAITVRPWAIAVGADRYFEVDNGLYLYLLSLHTSAQNAHVIEIKK